MKLVSYDSRDALFSGLAEQVSQELKAALQGGVATLAVPGGTTPGPLFEALRQREH